MITKKVSLTNMYLFQPNGILKRYNTPEEIIEDHGKYKLSICQKRLDDLISKKTAEMNLALAKYKYIKLVLEGTIKVMGVKRDFLKQQIP